MGPGHFVQLQRFQALAGLTHTMLNKDTTPLVCKSEGQGLCSKWKPPPFPPQLCWGIPELGSSRTQVKDWIP